MLKYTKVGDVKSPERANNTDSGIDFFIPKNTRCAFGEYIIIGPKKRLILPLAIKLIIPKNYDLQLVGKSGLASKKGISILGGLIDNGYRGELSVVLYNTGEEPALLLPGQKIVQGVLREVGLHRLVEIEDSSFVTSSTDRGEGGFGSTGDGLSLNNKKGWEEF